MFGECITLVDGEKRKCNNMRRGLGVGRMNEEQGAGYRGVTGTALKGTETQPQQTIIIINNIY